MDSKVERLTHDPAGLNTAPSPATLARISSTDTALLFTRSHAATPSIDPDTWRLPVHGLTDRKLELSLAELRHDFQQREVTATLICAGLRRNEFQVLGDLGHELPWGPEAAGTATWRGVALSQVLDAAGVKRRARFVAFTGLDRIERSGRTMGFGGSISIEKARDADVILAFELNDMPLTPEHGFPLRAIVPGWIGARSVKWLGDIELTAAPSDNYFQTRAYRYETTPNAAADVSRGTPLEEVRLNAVILSPADGDRVPAGEVAMIGWAIGAGGRPLECVEISSDGGRSWRNATLDAPTGRWSWRRWHTTVTLHAGSHLLIARAWDDSGASQPERLEDVWNVKGYANNAWHRVSVNVVPI